MSSWIERPTEEARLLNPAFMAALLAVAVDDYEKRSDEGMPWLLAFLVLPLVLPARSRGVLPRNVSRYFPDWIQSEAELRSAFPLRARALAPGVREAMRFGIRHRVFAINGATLTTASTNVPVRESSKEVAECIKAARLVGRWFARGPDVATAYGLLGVRP